MVVTAAVLLTFLLQIVTGTVEREPEHSYLEDAKESLSHVIDDIKDEFKALQRRFEHSILHAEKGAFVFAGVLCSIAMLILLGGALYCHCFGNYVPKYIRIARRKDGKLVQVEPKPETNGRMKSE